jgi:hypothetical protein
MEKIILIVLTAIVIICIILFAIWVVVSAVVFVWQEMNHNIKNLKRAVKQGLWDLEWKFRRR